ncbi:MAG: DUF1553 domain-containing protein, partial [Bdellovibrionales bacterium]
DDEPDDKEQAIFDEYDEMLTTTSNAFLGLTLGCARCHDHKFDPIGQEDYYSMLAFVRNIKPYANELITLKSGGKTLAAQEMGKNPPATHMLIRGSAAAKGREVLPHFIRVLCPTSEAAKPQLPEAHSNDKTSGRRLVLANWIASKDNPLTARVLVNRLWHYHFGKGIVATPSDFGKTGVEPTHPELLDWLAADFMAGGWHIKRMHKLILLSETYRQSSSVKDEKAVHVDPGNTLLWRQNLRRLEAEVIRDTILSASGQLNLKMGGRGIFPTLPQEVLNTQSRPGAGWENNTPKEEQHRRSVYIFVKRTLGVPLLEVFDQASPDSSTARRAVTTIAPQALILLNSKFMEEQSSAFAERIFRETGHDGPKNIERMFRLAVARPPTRREMVIALEYLTRQRTRLKNGQPRWNEEAVNRQALAMLGKVILNLNELVYVD